MTEEEIFEQTVWEANTAKCSNRSDRIKMCRAYLDKYAPTHKKPEFGFTEHTSQHDLPPVFDKRIVNPELLDISYFQSDYDQYPKEEMEIAQEVRHGFAEKIAPYIVVKSYKDMARMGKVHRFTLGVWK